MLSDVVSTKVELGDGLVGLMTFEAWPTKRKHK